MTPIDWNKPVQTKDGRKVRVLCTDGPDEMFPVIGIIDGEVIPRRWNLLGTKDCAYGWDDVNLINAPEKHTLWVNVWRYKADNLFTVVDFDQAGSDRDASWAGMYKLIARIHHEFHEGEGLS